MKRDEDIVKRVSKFREEGLNCAQTVACALAEETALDEGLLFRLSEGFGGGMGGHQGTCGALSGAILILSYLNSGENTKLKTYAIVKELFEKFEEHFGTTICEGLKEKELCGECIEVAARYGCALIKGVPLDGFPLL